MGSRRPCVAWPTKRVREAILGGWLVYCGDAASWVASQGVETQRTNITIESAGRALDSSLERQFIAATRMAIFNEWQRREARRRGSWLHVPGDISTVWDDAMESELQRQIQTYRCHPGHW